jgi:hypothetical protein
MATYLDLSLEQWNDIKLRLVPIDQDTYALAIANMSSEVVGGGGELDAFGRGRVSTPYTLFDTVNQYNESPLFWETKLVGAGAITHLPNESSVRMNVGTASGDSVIRQSKGYIRYQPGKSQLILLTGVLGTAEANQVKRAGYYDNENGVFVELTDAGAFVVTRSYVSGAAVDTRVQSSNWNIDPMDGTGPSGHILDESKAQIFVIDLEWLGVGSVRIGFVIDGNIHYVHQFNHANILDNVYMTTANLPLRYEITNTGASVASSMKQICAMVTSEGGVQESNVTFSDLNTTLRVVTNAELPVIAIRPSTNYPASGSITNRAQIYPAKWSLYSEDGPLYYKLIIGCTVSGGAWNDVDANNSGVQVNKTGASVSGGIVIDSGVVAAKAGNAVSFVPGASEGENPSDLFLSLDIDGTVPTEFAIVCQRLTATDTDTAASVTWREVAS